MPLLWLSIFLVFLPPITHASPSPPDVSPRRIALLHMHDSAPFFSDLGALTYSNKLRYATRHSYEIAAHTPFTTQGLWVPSSSAPPCNSPAVERDGSCFDPDPSFTIDARAPTFGKIKLALAACVGRDDYWLLWSDADALIVNQSVQLESIIDDRYDIMVSVDWLMINAGVILLKCSDWTKGFFERVYSAREFDDARALDQSAIQHFFDTEKDAKAHVKYVPKSSINVYVEEYRPGDFLLHMAGKLYEATSAGALALAKQFDVLSMVDDEDDITAFFRGQYILGYYSGVCKSDGKDSECPPGDNKRIKLTEPLGTMSTPNRYRHVGLRYYWLGDWKDSYDFVGWDKDRKPFIAKQPPSSTLHDEL